MIFSPEYKNMGYKERDLPYISLVHVNPIFRLEKTRGKTIGSTVDNIKNKLPIFFRRDDSRYQEEYIKSPRNTMQKIEENRGYKAINFNTSFILRKD